MKYLSIGILLTILLIYSCGKENGGEETPEEDLIFQSLVAEKDTLISGDTTMITAIATGIDLSYHWSATKGDLLGSGAKIIYASSRCHIGKNQITCKVTDKYSQSESKTIDIIVAE